MLKIQYVNGSVDGTLALDPSQLTGDLSTDRNSAYVRQFESGKMVTFDSNGYAKLAVDGDLGAGPLVLDAYGADFENVPALASGVMSYMIGGGVAYTDHVVDTNIVPGDALYLATGADAGKLTKTAGTGPAVGVARSANSASDATVLVHFF